MIFSTQYDEESFYDHAHWLINFDREPERSIIIAGGWRCGKTTAAIALASMACYGTKWAGIECKSRRDVLFISNSDGNWGYDRKIRDKIRASAPRGPRGKWKTYVIPDYETINSVMGKVQSKIASLNNPIVVVDDAVIALGIPYCLMALCDSVHEFHGLVSNIREAGGTPVVTATSIEAGVPTRKGIRPSCAEFKCDEIIDIFDTWIYSCVCDELNRIVATAGRSGIKYSGVGLLSKEKKKSLRWKMIPA